LTAGAGHRYGRPLVSYRLKRRQSRESIMTRWKLVIDDLFEKSLDTQKLIVVESRNQIERNAPPYHV
jgi:hypothetical protein